MRNMRYSPFKNKVSVRSTMVIVITVMPQDEVYAAQDVRWSTVTCKPVLKVISCLGFGLTANKLHGRRERRAETKKQKTIGASESLKRCMREVI